ncbi:MAG: beta-glucosidase, partial [Planctomycetota bacterium]
MSDTPPYRDAGRSVDERVADLLGRMTLAEKIGQMTQLDGRVDPLRMVAERQPGSFLQVLGEDVVPIMDANDRTRLAIPI